MLDYPEIITACSQDASVHGELPLAGLDGDVTEGALLAQVVQVVQDLKRTKIKGITTNNNKNLLPFPGAVSP